MSSKQQRVLQLLSDSQVLTVEPGFFIVETRTIHGVHGEGDDLAVSLTWRDDRNYEWAADFSEDSLDAAKVSKRNVQIVDTTGELVGLTPLRCVRCL